jgi:Amidase
MTGRDHIEAALDRARETAELNAFVTIADETAVRAPRATGGPLDTDPTAFASLPSISVPAGLTASGLPVGLSFDGLPGTGHRAAGARRRLRAARAATLAGPLAHLVDRSL